MAETSNKKTATYDKKLYGVLAWFVLPAIYFLLSDKYKKEEYLLYHSYMAVIVWLGNIVLRGVLNSLHMWALAGLVNLVALIAWIYGLVKAFQEEKAQMPMLSEWVDSLVKKHISK